MFTDCENCWYNALDEDEDVYFCSLYLDEDEFFSLQAHGGGRCKYFRPFTSEYDIVKKQN